MPLDYSEFRGLITASLDAYDWQHVEELCGELVREITTTGRLTPANEARRIMGELRRKRRFAAMEQIGDALISAGETNLEVRTQYVQALIDQGRLTAAENELQRILSEHREARRKSANVPKPHKAMGLFGRALKQKYVAMKSPERGAKVLRSAIDWYKKAYREDPAEQWYGINMVALTARAQRDGVDLRGAPDPKALARHILARIQRDGVERSVVMHWDLASCAEAYVALEDLDSALDWLWDYVHRKDADAFEVSATYRQMVEIWQLTDDVDPGRAILPLLRSAIAMRPGGSVELGREQVRAGLDKANRKTMQRAFGKDGGKTLAWYFAMLDAARGVARIGARITPDQGIGSGFLVRASDFLSPKVLERLPPGELVLLTNAHVVSSKNRRGLRPEEATATFEALEEKAREANLQEVLWESDDLDAALVLLETPVAPSPALSYNLTSDHTPPSYDSTVHRRVFVIGHPGGGALTISLQDSLQVGWDDPCLHYRTPTELGSSGSPVFDDYWNVLALHRAACEHIVRPGVIEPYDANEGIWIAAIRDASKQEKGGDS